MFQSHPEAARAALSDMGLQLSEPVLAAITHHHERFDGGGYPAGKKGDDIPLAGRIVHVADEYDSLTSWRASRDAWDPEAALAELRQDAENGKLDPKVAEVFCRAIEAARQAPPPQH